MKKKITVLTLSALLYALCLPVWAQQPAKVPRIGYVGPATTIPAPRHSGKGCGISAIRRIKISWLSIVTLGERRTGTQMLWLSLCNSTWMFSSPCLFKRSSQPSRRPRRFRCHSDNAGSGRDRDSRQLGATGWKYYGGSPGSPEYWVQNGSS